MVGDGALRATWNRSLLCEIVVPCYTRLLQLAAQRCGPGPAYDALWPVRAGGPAWAELLDAFFVAAAPLPLLHTALPPAASRAGRWVGGSSSSSSATEGQWVAPRDAVVIPSEARRLQEEQAQGEGEAASSAASLDGVLLLEGLPVLKTTRPQLEEALVARKVAPRVATPEFVRAHFRVPVGPDGQDPKQQYQQQLLQQHPALKEPAAVVLLLRYCVSDLSDRSFVEALEGLPLLPCNEACVVRLSAKLPVLLLPATSAPPLAPPLLAALRGIGVLTVHDAVVAAMGEARLGVAVRAFVLPARRSGVLAALRLVGRGPRYGGGQEGQLVLEALSRALATAWGPEAKDALRALLVAEPLATLTQEELALVKALPVFRVYGGAKGGDYVSLLGPAALHLLEGVPSATLQPLEGLLSAQFLRLGEDPMETALLRRLARPLPKAAFLLDHFFPAYPTYPPALRARAMLELVLADLTSLAQSDSRMLPALRELPFLPTAGGDGQQQHLARCVDLYDPEVEELTELVGSELFPHPDFAAPETLALLRQLGLRSTLRFGDVVRIARSTQAVYEEAVAAAAASKGRGGKGGANAAAERAEGALGRARMLFKFVNDNAGRFFTPVRESAEVAALRRKSAGGLFSRALSLFDEQARAAERHRQLQLEEEERQRQAMLVELKAIRWVPVLAAPPLPYLPWRQPPEQAGGEGPGLGLGLAVPARTRLYEDMWYASSCFGIVAQGTYVAELVKAAYGWKAPLSPAVVAGQLVAIAAAFHEFSSSSSEQQQQPGGGAVDPSSSPSPPPAVQTMQQQLTSVVPVVYQMLSSAPSEAQQVAVRQALAGAPWVFVGDRFVQAEQVAFAAQVNATPYLYSVPADLACFAPLLKAHGVRASFGAGDFVQVLQAMAVETGATAAAGGGGGGNDGATPLTPQQLELAIALVQRISDESMMVGNWEVFVPDEGGRLARSSALVYDGTLLGLACLLHVVFGWCLHCLTHHTLNHTPQPPTHRRPLALQDAEPRRHPLFASQDLLRHGREAGHPLRAPPPDGDARGRHRLRVPHHYGGLRAVRGFDAAAPAHPGAVPRGPQHPVGAHPELGRRGRLHGPRPLQRAAFWDDGAAGEQDGGVAGPRALLLQRRAVLAPGLPEHRAHRAGQQARQGPLHRPLRARLQRHLRTCIHACLSPV